MVEKVCDQEDCPLFLKENYIALDNNNNHYLCFDSNGTLTITNNVNRNNTTIIATEYVKIPIECLICNRKKDVDIYKEIIACQVKKELLNK